MRPIDADRLKEVFHRNVVSAEAFNVLIDNAPTADVVEVKHGKNISDSGFLCSVCSFGDFGGFHGYEPNYCPNCGADMRSK